MQALRVLIELVQAFVFALKMESNLEHSKPSLIEFHLYFFFLVLVWLLILFQLLLKSQDLQAWPILQALIQWEKVSKFIARVGKQSSILHMHMGRKPVIWLSDRKDSRGRWRSKASIINLLLQKSFKFIQFLQTTIQSNVLWPIMSQKNIKVLRVSSILLRVLFLHHFDSCQKLHPKNLNLFDMVTANFTFPH